MFRSGASRAVLRSLTTSSSPVASSTSAFRYQRVLRSQLCTLSRSSPLSPTKPLASKTLALVRHASRTNTGDTSAMADIDSRHESEVAKEKLEVHPESVSSTSSIHPFNSELGGVERLGHKKGEEDEDTDMLAGVRGDLKTIQETFSLEEVPRQAYYVGMAGVIPYLATSLSTVFCAWEINHSAATGAGLLMSHETAEMALHVIEPLQIGYGATIISFLGAIHWGLEFAGYGGYQGYPRYNIGIVATGLAWPTILMPVEYALISQFLIFNFLYYTDSRATKRGWAPHWYGVYRFVLTFIVGASIVASLIGRGQIMGKIDRLPGPSDRIQALRESQSASLEEEEDMRRKLLASKDEEEDEEEEEE